VRGYGKFVALPLILAAMGLAHPGSTRGQANALSEEANTRFGNATQRTVCEEPNADQSVEAALRLICLRDLLGTRHMSCVPVADTKGNHRSQMGYVVDR